MNYQYPKKLIIHQLPTSQKPAIGATLGTETADLSS